MPEDVSPHTCQPITVEDILSARLSYSGADVGAKIVQELMNQAANWGNNLCYCNTAHIEDEAIQSFNADYRLFPEEHIVANRQRGLSSRQACVSAKGDAK